MIFRSLQPSLLRALSRMPAVALLGPRQVGKTTLALEVAQAAIDKPVTYLDLELDSDRTKLQDPETYLRSMEGRLLIIDEVQQMPGLFRTLRGIIDDRKRKGEPAAQFLMIGSASRDLLRQSSESLAGRIRYLELSPFRVPELLVAGGLDFSLEKLWLRGGFPLSYLAPDEEESWAWRSDFLSTYVERDIPQLGMDVSPTRMRRFWTMLAHLQGQQVNLSSLGKSLEVSHTSIRTYLDLLTDLYMVRQLPPWSGNTKKRLVKSPKVYVRDLGLLHRLLAIPSFEDLLGHPVAGHSWEGFVIENILAALPDQWQASYYRTATQTEIGLVLERGHQETWAVEIKRSVAPKVAAGFHTACEDVQATRKWVLYSGQDRFPIGQNTEVIGLAEFLTFLQRYSPDSSGSRSRNSSQR